MRIEVIDKLARVKTFQDIEALPQDTEYVFTSCIDDAKIKALSRFKALKTLMNDGNSFITNEGLKILSMVTSLEELDLEWSDSITDEGLAHLESLAQLRWLDIGYCHKTSQEGAQRLKKALPKCEIITEKFEM